MASDTTISTIALAVALVALLTTLSQVIGQFLATADGYRRCRPSVMGGWAKLTRRRFRWSELRFETLYTTPTFGMEVYRPSRRSNTPGFTFVDATSKSYHDSYSDHTFKLVGTETVSWVHMILTLQAHASTLTKEIHHSQLEYDCTMPAIWPAINSWDFVPPEVVRPLARSSISDVAILVRRLGMEWKQFDPSEGTLKAEGNGYTMSSTTVRTIGTVLQFISRKGIKTMFYTEKPFKIWSLLADPDQLYIPSEVADMMGFGILQGDRNLYLPDYKIGTEAEVLALLRDIVDPTRRAHDVVEAILVNNPGWTPGISDIVGSAAPMVRIRHTSIVRVPQPIGFVGERIAACIVVFFNRLRSLVSDRDAIGTPVSQQTRSILHQHGELKSRYGELWEDWDDFDRVAITRRSVDFLDDLHDRHDGTTDYFISLRKRYWPRRSTSRNVDQGFRYTDLIYSHITHAVSYYPEALKRINASPSQARDNYGLRDAGWIVEGAHIYFDNIPKVIKSMRDRGFDHPEIVEEAWLTMVFRAFLWHRCHFMVDGPRVPSTHWGSELPVYIG